MDKKLGPGFSSIEIEGRPGIYIIDSEGSWDPKGFSRFFRVIKGVSSELKISTDIKRLQVEYVEIGNDWKAFPKGEQYLERLARDGLVALRDKLINLYQPQVKEWIKKAFERHAPADMLRPLAVTPQPRQPARRRLFTKRPPANKQRRQDHINRQ